MDSITQTILNPSLIVPIATLLLGAMARHWWPSMTETAEVGHLQTETFKETQEMAFKIASHWEETAKGYKQASEDCQKKLAQLEYQIVSLRTDFQDLANRLAETESMANSDLNIIPSAKIIVAIENGDIDRAKAHIEDLTKNNHLLREQVVYQRSVYTMDQKKKSVR